jgi:hypothetical protein
MSTVNCPNCNKPNIEGSKFCNSCGFALPLSTHIICPNCETRNPRNLLYCDNCGTRLSATGELSSRREEEKEPEAETRTPRAFSLPTREPGDELDPDNLLDLLKTGKEQYETPSGQEAVLDDWLNDLSDIEPTGTRSEEEELSDWFQDIEAAEEAEDEPEGLASWFSDSGDTSVEEGGLSDWLAELETTEDEGGEDEHSAVDETIPDWLSDLDDDDSQDESGEESLADWLNDFNLEEDTADPAAELAETDIFSPVDSSEADTADTLIAPSPLQEDEEIPDWLSTFDSDEEMPTLVAPTPEAKDDEEIPDWLSDLNERDDDMPTLIGSSPAMEEEALPDWLSETAPEDETVDEESS